MWRLLLALVLLGSSTAHAKLRVVAATNDIGALAHAAGGEHIQLEVVARRDRDPHGVEVRPATLRKTAKAQVYLKVGLSLDLWSDAIIRGSRNKNLTIIDCSEAITPLEVLEGRVDASKGDVHPEGNPHYWLDPVNALDIVVMLAEKLSELEPEHADEFRRNAEEFAAEVNRLMPHWSEQLAGLTFVEYHRSWVYFASRFEAVILGSVEPLPGIPPPARHLIALSEQIRNSKAKIVVRDPYYSDAPVEFLERETGIVGVILPVTCPEPTQESYLNHMNTIVEVLGGGRP